MTDKTLHPPRVRQRVEAALKAKHHAAGMRRSAEECAGADPTGAIHAEGCCRTGFKGRGRSVALVLHHCAARSRQRRRACPTARARHPSFHGEILHRRSGLSRTETYLRFSRSIERASKTLPGRLSCAVILRMISIGGIQRRLLS